jgi:hypothetical protein
MQRHLDEVNKYGKPAQGKDELTRHLQGRKITRKEAMRAHCYMCMGYFSDGRFNCEMPHCPIYPWMPYSRIRTEEG